ncbi:unnamed protein product [Strongylus vulgaris]|uniref:Uncharacterized protein n=1 Tax=Strongylus vulgaris TaxID=40348 RepID=A0A3P7J681_STRVU|nr:unnamed protein product [Strongylus vulgaris]
MSTAGVLWRIKAQQGGYHSQLPHIRLPGLCFLQGDYAAVDAPCSFEKGVKIVGRDCPGVIDVENETISMASRLSFWSEIRGQPDTGLDEIRASFSLTSCTVDKTFPQTLAEPCQGLPSFQHRNCYNSEYVTSENPTNKLVAGPLLNPIR